MAATSAFAQSSVTLSGRVDAGYGSRIETSTAGVKTNTSAIGYSGINTSFIALGGKEDLGGGLTAGFYVETKILDGANTFGDRGSYLTLEGGFGKVIAGTQNTGARDMFIAYDAGGAINVAGSLNSSTGNDSGNANSASAGTLNNTGSHAAFSTGIKYIAPTMSGLTLSGAVSRNNVNYSDATVDTKTGQGYSVGGNYVNGPLSVGVSYSDAKTVANATTDLTTKTTAAGASYDLGVAKLYVAHFKLDHVNAAAPTATTGNNVQRKSTTYGVRVPVTPKLTAFASMGTGNLQFGNGYDKDLSAQQFGGVYELSKRTSLKAAYGATKTDETATTQTKVKETALALVHLF